LRQWKKLSCHPNQARQRIKLIDLTLIGFQKLHLLYPNQTSRNVGSCPLLGIDELIGGELDMP
jgi:hypothetical protein